jgi:hypothetical protein
MAAFRPYWWLLVLLVALPAARGQEQLRELPGIETSPRFSNLVFERVLNTYAWYGRAAYDKSFESSWVLFSLDLRSRLVQTDIRSIQDEVGVLLDAGYHLAPRWDVRGLAESVFLTDSRAFDLSDLSQHSGLAGLRYGLMEGIDFSALGGVEFSRQEGIQDQGFSYLMELRGSRVRLGEFSGDFLLTTASSQLGERRPWTTGVAMTTVRDFEGGALNRLGLMYSDQRREFYTAADSATSDVYGVSNNILRRDAQEFALADTFQMRRIDGTELYVTAGIYSRVIERGNRYKVFSPTSTTDLDRRIEEFRYFGGISGSTRVWSWLTGGFTVSYDERDEKHRVLEDPGVSDSEYDRQQTAARRLNNVARRSMVGLRLLSPISPRDSLQFVGSASILRYDTPDTLNIDDRDELLIVLGVGEQHRFSNEFFMEVLLEATLSHLVYLNPYASANNNWNRILRLRARTEYVPVRWLWTVNSAEVMANYTVYDFEEQVSSVKSFAFRQALWVDSTSVAFDRMVSLLFAGTVRAYERGLLRWTDFKEQPEDFFLEQFYWPRFILQMDRQFSMGIGYRFFAQDRYVYEGSNRQFSRRLMSRGPTAHLLWEDAEFRQARIEGWLETQFDGGRKVRTVPNLLISVGILF